MSSFMLQKSVCSFSMVVLSCLFVVSSGASADPVLDIVIAGQSRQFGRDELSLRPDVADVAVSSDVAYGKPMSYRAVPLAALLVGLNPPPDSVIESVALDGLPHNCRSIFSSMRTPPRLSRGLPSSLLTCPGRCFRVRRLAQVRSTSFGPERRGSVASNGRTNWPASRANPRQRRAGLSSMSIRRCRPQIQAAPAWFTLGG